jgi:hypothetical protein
MKRRFGTKTVLGLAVTALFLWLAFRRIPLGEFARAMGEVRLLPAAAAMACQLLAHVLRAWRWKLFLMGTQPDLHARDTFAALMVGYGVNVAVPRGGEVARAVFLQRMAGVPFGAGLSTVITERLLDLMTLAALFPPLVLVYRGRLEHVFPGIGNGVFLTAAVAAGALAVAWWLARDPEKSSRRLGGLLGRFAPAVAERASAASRHFLKGLGGIFQRQAAPGVAVLTGAIWFFYALGFWFLFHAFHFADSISPGIMDALGITLIMAVAYALPSPGGTGTTHFFASQFLIGLLGVSSPEALAYATLAHALGVLPGIFLGGGYALLAQPSKTEKIR